MIALYLKSIIFKIIICLLPFSIFANNNDYSKKNFVNDLTSPIENETSLNILKYSSVISLGLYLTRRETVYPLQETFVKNKPLGSFSKLGDYAGKSIQNAFYVGHYYYDYYFNKNLESYHKSKIMFKATFFSGLITTILKHAVREQRPSGGDFLSFPSGHTTVAFAFSGVYSYFNPEYKLWAHGLATLTGLSRINDNAHYLHDVAFGAGLGLAYAYAFTKHSNDNTNSSINYLVIPVNNQISFLTYVNI